MTNEKMDTQLKEDYLYEMSGVYNDKIYVGVNPDSKKDWFKNEYFYVFNNPSYRKAELAARIEFRAVNYLPNNETRQNGILNDADKQVLISFLKSSSVNFPKITNWQECILYFNPLLQDSLCEQDLINEGTNLSQYQLMFVNGDVIDGIKYSGNKVSNYYTIKDRDKYTFFWNKYKRP